MKLLRMLGWTGTAQLDKVHLELRKSLEDMSVFL